MGFILIYTWSYVFKGFFYFGNFFKKFPKLFNIFWKKYKIIWIKCPNNSHFYSTYFQINERILSKMLKIRHNYVEKDRRYLKKILKRYLRYRLNMFRNLRGQCYITYTKLSTTILSTKVCVYYIIIYHTHSKEIIPLKTIHRLKTKDLISWY